MRTSLAVDDFHHSDSTFLFSATTRNPDRFFHGYAFKGSDFIFGDDGLKAYERDTGNFLTSGEDGAYVIAARHGNNYLFGSDHSGYKNIFYFHDGAFWAVSNSLTLLAEHLKKNRISVDPEFAQLSITGIEFPPIQQLSTFSTMVRGIRLLPTGFDLAITSRSAKIEKSDILPCGRSYEESLARFLEIWVARIETMLVDGRINIVADLTGGLDSRTVFSLMQKAIVRLNTDVGNAIKLQCHEIGGNKTDADIAREVLQETRTLHPARFDTIRFQREGQNLSTTVPHLDGRSAARRWMELSLGVYNPIRLPPGGFSQTSVYFGGGSGENYRLFYGKHFANEQLFVASCASKLRPRWLGIDFRRDLSDALHFLSAQEARASISPLVLHYREFRGRIHGGQRAKRSISITPLGSRYLGAAARFLDRDRLEAGQILYDIMHSVGKHLLDVRFDIPGKRPTDEIVRRFPKVAISEYCSPGKVYMTPVVNGATGDPQSGTAIHHLKHAFDLAVKRRFVREFCGEETIALASGRLEQAVQAGRFVHPTQASPVSGVLAAGIFDH